MERGLPPPEWYAEEPELLPYSEFYLRAFWELSTERQFGYTLGPIPISKLKEFCDRLSLDHVTSEVVKAVIRAMDGAYMEWVTEERKKNTGDDRLSHQSNCRSGKGKNRY